MTRLVAVAGNSCLTIRSLIVTAVLRSLTAAFCTRCILFVRTASIPYTTELQ